MDRLAAMRTFVAVHDAGSFSEAARRLGLSLPVVSRSLVGLEAHLGVRLMHRTTRALHLTEAGERYLHHARRLLADVEAAEEEARGESSQPTGTLVVSASHLFGRMHVGRMIRDYLAHHPDTRAELQLNDRNVNLVEEGIDVAIRIGVLADSGLVARPLGSTRRVVAASPGYLRERGRPAHPADLADHATISFGPSHGGREWRFVDATTPGREISVEVAPRLTTNGGDAAIEFACDGGGCVRALHYQVAEHLARGELVLILEAFERPPTPIHAVYPSARLVPARVRAFLDIAQAGGERRY